MITIRDLKKNYQAETVLDIPQLSIEAGECFGLVGNNGAGKTTLFRLILDLIRSTSGSISIGGEPVQASEEWKLRVGSYLDEHMLLPFLTPDEYFETLGDLHNLSKQQAEEELRRFEPLFNGEIRNRKKYIRDLSKGNIKKTGIAAAFLDSPEIVILDEPFENLDPTSQNRLKYIIREENNRGTTFLISSHDLAHVTDICSRIVLLEDGRILQDLTGEKASITSALDQYFNH